MTEQACQDDRRLDRADLVLCALLLIAAGVIFSKDISVGGVRWKDESTHIMDGVLLLDWVAAGPDAWRHPVEFASQQYARFPNLGMVGVYPPGFAMIEAAMFAVTGVSIIAARGLVAAFGLSAVVAGYLLLRNWGPRRLAVCGTAAMIGLPMMVTWTRQAMLEMPTLAVLLWLLYATDRYVARPTWRRLAIVLALTLAAPLFKQTAVFIVPVLAITAGWLCRRGLIPRRQFAFSAMLIGLLLGVYLGWSIWIQGGSQLLDRGYNTRTALSQWFSWAQISYYGASALKHSTWPVAAMAGLGLLCSMRVRDWRWLFVALWFVSAYALLGSMQYKEPRYFFFGYLPIALWTGLGLSTLLGLIRGTRLRAALACLPILGLLVLGYQTKINYRPDFGPLAAAYASEIREGVVFVEADYDTSFVLAARSTCGPGRGMVVRGSKLLYSCSSDVKWDFKSSVSSPADVDRLMEPFAFDLIFAERGNPLGLKEVDYLHAELADAERYEHVATHELGLPGGFAARPVVMDVYRMRNPPARKIREIEIPVPLARRTVHVTIQ